MDLDDPADIAGSGAAGFFGQRLERLALFLGKGNGNLFRVLHIDHLKNILGQIVLKCNRTYCTEI